MRRPGGLRGFVGRPAVTLVAVGLACLSLYNCYLRPDAWPLAVAGVCIAGWAGEANTAVARYRAWKREWDGMGPGGARPRIADHPAAKATLLALLVVGVAAYLDANADQPGFRLAFDWLVGGGAFTLVGWLAVRRLRSGRRPIWTRSRRQRGAEPVRLCVRSALIRVPDLTGAYDALPEHCWRALDGR